MNNSFQHADLMTILEGASRAVVKLDGSANSVAMNAAAEEMFRTLGHEPREVLGKAVWNLFSDVMHTVVEQNIRTVLEYDVPMQYEFFCPVDKHWYETHAYPTLPGALVTFREITHR
jgi:PAS domain S-box-containing protein